MPAPAISIRTPLYGLISPKTTIAVHLDPHLKASERAIVICTTPDQVTWQVMNPQIVIISNQSTRALVWTLVFTPASDVLPPFEAWGPLITDVLAKIASARDLLRAIRGEPVDLDPGTTSKPRR